MSYLRLLRDRPAFRRLWWGDVVSLIGDWFNMIAVYTAVQRITPSSQALAAVFAAKTVPSLLVAPLAGPLVDRFDRRTILVATDVFRALMVGVLIVAHRMESLVGLYLALIGVAMASGIVGPARSAVLPTVVEKEEVPAANALEGATWAFTLSIGSALGGVATALLDVDAALLLDVASYLVSVVFFLGLPALPAPGRHERDGSFRAGLRYLFDDRKVLALTSLKPMMALAGGAIVLIPIFGASAPELTGPIAVGLLFLARGAGVFAGSLIRSLSGDRPEASLRAVAFGFILFTTGFFGLSMASGLAAGALAFGVAGTGSGIVWVMSNALLMSTADPRFHGRLFAVELGVMTLVSALSAWAVTSGIDAGLSIAATALALGLVMLVPVGVSFAILLRAQRLPSALVSEAPR